MGQIQFQTKHSRLLKFICTLPLLGLVLAAEPIPWVLATPTVGIGWRSSSNWAGNDKHSGSQTYYDFGIDVFIKRDFRIYGTLNGTWRDDKQMFPNSYPAIPQTNEMSRDGQTRDYFQDLKLGVGYNVLGLTGIDNHLLFLNVGYIFRDLEKDWSYQRIKWDSDLITIELAGEHKRSPIQSFVGWINSGSWLYGLNYRIPRNGHQGFSDLGYDVKGWESEFYVGVSRDIISNTEFFVKATFGMSRFDETLQYTPTIKTKSRYVVWQLGLRGSPFAK